MDLKEKLKNYKLENPKIIIYENVDKIVSILERNVSEYDGSLEALAMKILDKFNMSYGKRTELEPFQNNISAKFDGKKIIWELK